MYPDCTLHGCVLMLCGHDWGWWQAWTYSLLFVSAGIGLRRWAVRRHPGLMDERAQLLRAPGVRRRGRLRQSIPHPLHGDAPGLTGRGARPARYGNETLCGLASSR
jgi:hypothetical protein